MRLLETVVCSGCWLFCFGSLSCSSKSCLHSQLFSYPCWTSRFLCPFILSVFFLQIFLIYFIISSQTVDFFISSEMLFTQPHLRFIISVCDRDFTSTWIVLYIPSFKFCLVLQLTIMTLLGSTEHGGCELIHCCHLELHSFLVSNECPVGLWTPSSFTNGCNLANTSEDLICFCLWPWHWQRFIWHQYADQSQYYVNKFPFQSTKNKENSISLVKASIFPFFFSGRTYCLLFYY